MIGKTLSHFKITAKLGEGGMGEVYRAEDSKLGRDVALKLLPEAVEQDAERLARFEREAKVLAALDHPNIAAIYGLEEDNGRHVLVMQLAEGETLQERIARGVVPPEEAISIVVQIAEAVEAAHEKGIIHRDLKPANIKLNSENQVKVLDFGLAKALDTTTVTGTDPDRNQSPPALSLSPTLTAQMTQPGVILGTAAYMSPEQARGLEADERSDIWSFGVVLYEMLTGRQSFRGETVSDTLASILKEEPDLSALPPDTPQAVRRVLGRSLEKNPKDRLHSIADVRIDLQSADSQEVAPLQEQSSAGQRRVGWGGLLAAVVAGALLTLGLMQLMPGSSTPSRAIQPLHLTINPPGELLGATQAVISRQGDFVVFVGFDGSTSRLYLRRLGEFETEVLDGTEGASGPTLSPDGRWVAFVADGKLKKMAVAGGHPLVLGDLAPNSPGIRWGPGDSILFTPTWVGFGLHRVSAGGGEPETLTELDKEAGELGHWWPQFLPGEGKILFTLWSAGTGLNDADVAVVDLETGQTQVLFDGARAQYLASGHLLYYHAGNFLVVPFDLEALATTGPSVVVLPDAARENPSGGSLFVTSVSDDGTLVYMPKLPDGQISWLDRQGNHTLWPFEPASISGIDLGPDGRLAATILEGGVYQIRILDPESETEERFAFGDGSFFNPIWHPNGQSIAYGGLTSGSFDVVAKTSGEADPKILVSTDLDEQPTSWSADGSQLIYEEFDEQGKVHIRAISVADPAESVVLISGPASDLGARVSPDGHWLAFHSDREGRSEVYVQRFPEAGQVFKVSRSGGSSVRWADDGESLYYLRASEIFEVRFREEGGRFVVESESSVLDLPPYSGDYDVAPDGRFVVVTPIEVASSEFKVITNWFEELERIAPSRTD